MRYKRVLFNRYISNLTMTVKKKHIKSENPSNNKWTYM